MSSFDTPWFDIQEGAFFSHLSVARKRHVIITGETTDFAKEVIDQWTALGFHVQYVAMDEDESVYTNKLRTMGDEIPVGDTFAIIGFGDAASVVLQAFAKPNSPRLVAIVAYYPSAIPEPTMKYPPSIRVLVHLAGEEIDVGRRPEVLGISSSKLRTVRKRIDSGIGFGGYLKLAYRAYTYEQCESGFAEHDLDDYDPIAERLAFSRSVATVNRAFKIEEDVEQVRDDCINAAVHGDVDSIPDAMDKSTSILNVPTLTGGVGVEGIKKYFDHSTHPLPPSATHRLLSRTSGPDRVVDEILLSFKHTISMPWMLPGIPPTNRAVEIVLVSISCIRAGILRNEHVYWDQASVLVQIGLLDPKAVPDHWRKEGVKQLPVIGSEAAKIVQRGDVRTADLARPVQR